LAAQARFCPLVPVSVRDHEPASSVLTVIGTARHLAFRFLVLVLRPWRLCGCRMVICIGRRSPTGISGS
jgi:hypothetical protein